MSGLQGFHHFDIVSLSHKLVLPSYIGIVIAQETLGLLGDTHRRPDCVRVVLAIDREAPAVDGSITLIVSDY